MRNELVTQIFDVIKQYFSIPIEQSSLFYPAAQMIEVEQARVQYSPLARHHKAVGAKWSLQLMDILSENVFYAHVEYGYEKAWRQEVLFFLRVQTEWKLMSVLRAYTPSRHCNIHCPVHQQSEELKAISDMLLRYGDGVYNLNATKALEEFDPHCRMLHPVADGTTFADVSVEVFHERWSGLEHPSAQGIPQFTRIYHIEMLNHRVAIAKVGVSKRDENFNDYLACVKCDGQWKIVGKITDCLWIRPT